MSATEQHSRKPLLLSGGLVFDGSGSEPTRGDVLVQEGRIIRVGVVDRASTRDAERVDLAGATILPGFIDCHVHVLMSELDMWTVAQTPFSLNFYLGADNLRRTLETGITTVRDAAGADYGVKRALELGIISGPRLLIAITMLSQTGGHGDGHLVSGCDVPFMQAHPGAPDGVIDGAVEARRKVRELVRARADWIKIATSGGVLSEDDPNHRQLRDDELAEIVTEATFAGVDVMAHAHAVAGVKAAVRSGVRSIEHGVHLDDEAIAMMAERGTWLVPTLTAPLDVIQRAENGQVSLPSGAVEKSLELAKVHADSFARAVAAGVNIAMGTDTGVGVHGDNLSELGLMARAGMEPLQVLRAATSGGARLLRLEDEIGSVRDGLRADLVVVQGDIGDLATIRERLALVIQAGRIVVRH